MITQAWQGFFLLFATAYIISPLYWTTLLLQNPLSTLPRFFFFTSFFLFLFFFLLERTGFDKKSARYLRCNKVFTEATNTDTSCSYHEIGLFDRVGPGNWWNCCKKYACLYLLYVFTFLWHLENALHCASLYIRLNSTFFCMLSNVVHAVPLLDAVVTTSTKAISIVVIIIIIINTFYAFAA